MANTQPIFSESWHRVANLRVALSPALEIRKQLFRGQTWYLLQDPFGNEFYRLQPEAFSFVSRLQRRFTVAQVWQKCLETAPEHTPGQEEVIQLLAQLHHANLLLCDLSVDSQQLFAKFQYHRQRELRSTLTNLMFLRLPLFDPSRFLDRFAALGKLLTSRCFFLLWLLILLLALKGLIENPSPLASEAGNLLHLNNLLLLYAGLLVSKSMHELGHALLCRKYGGEVHSLGIMLIVFTPLPYVDATASWSFRSCRQRILVSAAGMLFEFFVASCACLIWLNSAPGTLHSFAFNLMFVASVSTLAFNLNPLLKYDGYYILVDLLGLPNLQSRSAALLKQWLGSLLSGHTLPATEHESLREKIWLLSYAILSGGYRLLIYGSITLFVADRYLLLGSLMASFCLFTWLILPAARLIRYLSNDPSLRGRRSRILTLGTLGLTTVCAALLLIPIPHSFRAPGILEADNLIPVLTESPGQLLELPQANNLQVAKGSILARLSNPELDFQIRALSAQRAEVLALQQQNITGSGTETRDILQQQLKHLDSQLDQLRQQQQQLTVVAPVSGTWIDRESQSQTEAWLPRGSQLGKLISGKKYRFSAVISQEDAATLFSRQQPAQASVRLHGQSGIQLEVSRYRVIPFQQQQLPSAALGQKAGGSIAVASDDQQGLRTREPFFRIDAELKEVPAILAQHGHSGKIRFRLKPEPLLRQILHRARQFFLQRNPA